MCSSVIGCYAGCALCSRTVAQGGASDCFPDENAEAQRRRLLHGTLDSGRDGISSVLSRTHLAYSAYLARAPFFPPEVGDDRPVSGHTS